MTEYHVGCGICGIYAGTLNKKGDTWRAKTDVTTEALNSSFEYLYLNKKEFHTTVNDKEYVMMIVPVEESEVEE